MNCCWECKLVQPLWKTVWRFLKKLKIELSYNPAISLLGIYLRKYDNTKLRRHTNPDVPSSIIYNYQDMEATKCPSTDEWRKRWYVYVCVCVYKIEYYSAIKKNEILPFSKHEWNGLGGYYAK